MEAHMENLIHMSQQQGHHDEIEKLQELLANYKKERGQIEGFMKNDQNVKTIKEPKDVRTKLEKLFHLQHNGEDIKQMFDELEKIRIRDARFLRRPL